MRIVLFCLLLPLMTLAQKAKVLVELPNGKTVLAAVNTDSTYSGFKIYNHKMEYKSTFSDFRGVPLRELLRGVDLGNATPRELSTYYFVVEAVDGYKVVFSWNELFNHPAGNDMLWVTESKGLVEDLPIVLSRGDVASGRRFVKQVKKISVKHL